VGLRGAGLPWVDSKGILPALFPLIASVPLSPVIRAECPDALSFVRIPDECRDT
jgi:hypothetical protein